MTLVETLLVAAIQFIDYSGTGWKDVHAVGVIRRAPIVCRQQYGNGTVKSITRYPNNVFHVICRRGSK